MLSITKDTGFMLSEASSILDAIELINSSTYLIAVVVNEKKQLVGTITDGDIRRGLIGGKSINDSCKEIMNREPFASIEADTQESRMQLMKANDIKQLPLINSTKEVVGLIYFGELVSKTVVKNKMLIMAGGFGKRMHPLTENTPKPMLLLGDKPILEHIILKAKTYGFRNFLISTHYLPERIVDYFGNGTKLGIKIEYLHENKPLGTAGAISLINERLDHPLLITNGDLLIDINYKNLLDFHNNHGADATMAIRKHIIENPFGVVKTSGLLINSIQEKPKYESNVNAGIYVINNRIKEFIQPNEYIDMPDLFEKLIQRQKCYKLIAYPLHENWLDIGNPSDLNTANKIQKY